PVRCPPSPQSPPSARNHVPHGLRCHLVLTIQSHPTHRPCLKNQLHQYALPLSNVVSAPALKGIAALLSETIDRRVLTDLIVSIQEIRHHHIRIDVFPLLRREPVGSHVIYVVYCLIDHRLEQGDVAQSRYSRLILIHVLELRGNHRVSRSLRKDMLYLERLDE